MDTDLQPGNILLGKYRVERVLGQGGMGVVVAARHLDLGQLFAIKCMLPSALVQEDAVERFLREARAAAGLKGEHVVKVVDVGRLDTGAPYMVMEHLSGSDLGAILESRGALSVGEAVTCVLEACDALEEAHGMGIVHRDLKPANLFLFRRPNGTTCVKVLDFGISKQVVPDQVALTKTSAIMGTPLYMSPEQMVSSRSVDARSDVWSMGVVLYELCTGKVPFDGQVVTEVVARVVQDDPVPPSKVRPNIPAGLDAVIARCLQKRPERRYTSIRELAAALRPFAGLPAPSRSTHDITEEDTVSATQASAAPVLTLQGTSVGSGSSAPRRRTALAMGVVAAGVVLALAAAGIWLSRASSAPPDPRAAAAPASADPPKASAAPPIITPAPSASAGATAAATPPDVKPAPRRKEEPARPAPHPRPTSAATAAPKASAPAHKEREPLF